jgi:hypothetical protein
LGATTLFDTEIWKALFDFQKDGVKGMINKILPHNGCVLADSVGLGKTYEALAVIKLFELRNERVLVLCPKKLRDNWTVYRLNDQLNPFGADRFRYDVLSHTDLSREAGYSGDINLETLNWGNFDLVVIDESHTFRNNTPGRRDEQGNLIRRSRYQRLMDDLRYRDRQLLQLKDEVLDLEDLEESISLTEFTLDDFRIDLLKYLETNRSILDAAPFGLYTVVQPHDQMKTIAPGVIWCLKQQPSLQPSAFSLQKRARVRGPIRNPQSAIHRQPPPALLPRLRPGRRQRPSQLRPAQAGPWHLPRTLRRQDDCLRRPLHPLRPGNRRWQQHRPLRQPPPEGGRVHCRHLPQAGGHRTPNRPQLRDS